LSLLEDVLVILQDGNGRGNRKPRPLVSGGAKVEENRRFENPVVAARKAGFRNLGFTG
jgi:hypothetical protein